MSTTLPHIPKAPRTPAIASAVDTPTVKIARVRTRKPSELRAAAALFVCLLGVMSAAGGAVMFALFP